MTSLYALVYTNDLFTAYVFVEINTLTACAIVMAKENGQTITATYQIFDYVAFGQWFVPYFNYSYLRPYRSPAYG